MEQASRQVDVVPVEPEQLAPAQPCIGHQREQQLVALGLARGVALPELVPAGLDEQALKLAHRQHVGESLALLRCSQRQRRVTDEALLLDKEAEGRCVTRTSARSSIP
jgi:hypothetical protein